MKTICVYCGSSSAVDDVYKEAARELGEIIGSNGMTLVYGGGHVGLMGLTADTTLKNGGKVVGIIPEFITKREVQHDHLTELHVVENMHQRKMMMAERSDGFVILPGGFGTMDEFFEILTWRQLSIHKKPIIIANIAGYWDDLLALADNIIGKGFAKESDKDHFKVVDKVENIVPALKALYNGDTALVWDRI